MEKEIQYLKTVNLRFIVEEEASSLFRVNIVSRGWCQVVINQFCGLPVIFCGFISHLIGRETINIPEIFSGVHSFSGKTIIKTKIPRFYRKRGSSTHNNLIGIIKAIWEPFVCRAKPSVPLKKIASWDIWFFTERDWSRECCYGNNIVGVILFLL